MKCQKCGYERRPQDDDFFPPTECPYCGIIYNKLKEQSTVSPENNAPDISGEKVPLAAFKPELPPISPQPDRQPPVSLNRQAPAVQPKPIAPPPKPEPVPSANMQPTVTPPAPVENTAPPRPAPGPIPMAKKQAATPGPEVKKTPPKRQVSRPSPESAVVKTHTAITLKTDEEIKQMEKERALLEKANKKMRARREKLQKRKERIARRRRASFERRYAHTPSLEESGVRNHCSAMVRKIGTSAPKSRSVFSADPLPMMDQYLKYHGFFAWGLLAFGCLGAVLIWVTVATAAVRSSGAATPWILSGAVGIFLGFASLLSGLFTCAACLLNGYLVRNIMEFRKSKTAPMVAVDEASHKCKGNCSHEAPELVDTAAG